MRRFGSALAAVALLIGSAVFAQTPISGLPSATTPLTGSEIFPVVQGGVTKKATVSSIPTPSGTLAAANNLSDVASAAASRTNLGLSAVAASGSASDLVTGTLPAAQMPGLAGDVTATTGSITTTIGAGTVTYSKMQNISAASRLLGRGATTSGSPQEITLGSNLTMSGTTLSATGAAGALLTANNLSDVANAATSRTNLGLGTAATASTGTSGANLGLLSTNNTHTGADTYSNGLTVNGGLGLGTPLAVASGGTNASSAAAAFTSLVAPAAAANSPGYIKFTNGLYLMWGSTSAAGGGASTTVTYDTELGITTGISTFSVAIVSGGRAADTNVNGPYVSATSTTGFTIVSNASASVTVFWFAVGA